MKRVVFVGCTTCRPRQKLVCCIGLLAPHCGPPNGWRLWRPWPPHKVAVVKP